MKQIDDWQDAPVDDHHIDDWQDAPVEDHSHDPGYAETGMRGLTQGASMGFQDELGGAISGLGRIAGFKDLEHGFQNGFERADDDLSLDAIKNAYVNSRDMERNKNAAAAKANPKTYMGGDIAGGLVPMVATGGESLLAKVGQGVVQGGTSGLGMSDADNLADAAWDTGVGATIGGVTGAALHGGGKVVGAAAPYLKKGINAAGDYFTDNAEKLAVKATGATGKQAEGFADDAGRQLLDRKLVRPFDSPQNISDRLGEEISANGKNIQRRLEDVTDRGQKIDLVTYLEDAETQIKELRNKGLFQQADALENETNRVIDNGNKMGVTEFNPIQMENIKRETQGGINYVADNTNQRAGKKAAASMQRQSVEDAMGADNPALLGEFQEEKKLHGLMSPIQDAAEKRASTLGQSPFGGLGDTAALAAGGPIAPFVRRLAAPRLASTAAFGADKIGQYIKQSPQMFGKFSSVLSKAAQRGPEAVSSTHFILEQTDPEYRDMMRNLGEGE